MTIQDLKSIEFLKLSDKQLDLLEKYMSLTLKENEKYDLTANDNVDEFITKNIIDSLLVCKIVDLDGQSVADIGSGAGLPGIPLAIYYPNSHFYLIEPSLKRTNFLNLVKKELNLTNIEIIRDRAEDFSFKNEEKFDFAVSRAVTKLNILLELSVKMLKIDGKLIAYKGLKAKEELSEAKNALEVLKSDVQEQKYDVPLPKTALTRSFIIIKKNEKTPKKYPRNYNQITKKPL